MKVNPSVTPYTTAESAELINYQNDVLFSIIQNKRKTQATDTISRFVRIWEKLESHGVPHHHFEELSEREG